MLPGRDFVIGLAVIASRNTFWDARDGKYGTITLTPPETATVCVHHGIWWTTVEVQQWNRSMAQLVRNVYRFVRPVHVQAERVFVLRSNPRASPWRYQMMELTGEEMI